MEVEGSLKYGTAVDMFTNGSVTRDSGMLHFPFMKSPTGFANVALATITLKSVNES